MSKLLRITTCVAALSLLPIGYAMGQNQADPKPSESEASLNKKIAKSTKVELRKVFDAKTFVHQKDGESFVCMPQVEGGNELPLFMTAAYCQALCPNGTPTYYAEWPENSGSGQSMCFCPHKNRTWVY